MFRWFKYKVAITYGTHNRRCAKIRFDHLDIGFYSIGPRIVDYLI